jgi:hypothetical protein
VGRYHRGNSRRFKTFKWFKTFKPPSLFLPRVETVS